MPYEPSYEPAPYRRWNPKPSWQSVHQHPAPKHEFVTVRRYDDGVEFKAKNVGSFWKDESGQTVDDAGLQWLMPI